MGVTRHRVVKAAQDDSVPLRCVIYCRISQDRESEERGVKRQEEDCRALAERNGWQVVRVYVDNDISASTRSKKKRPDYEAMFKQVREGGADVIVSYSNSRLTRRPLELEDLIQLHERTGVLFGTVVSGMDDLSTADGRMTARIKAAVDAAEAERTGERIRRAQQQRRAEGIVPGGQPVFGYVRPTRENGYRYLEVIDEAAAVAIKQAVEIVFTGGRPADVQRLWNNAGMLTPKGKPWNYVWNVARSLCNPKIAGLIVEGDEIIGEGKWPKIIDRATHDELVRLLYPRDGKARPRQYLLAGFVYCLCGAKMRAMVWNPQHYNGHNRYVCVSQRPYEGCGQNSRYRPWLETMVQEYVAGRLEAEREGTEEVPDDDPYADVEREINVKEALIRKIQQGFEGGLYTMAEATQQTIPLRAEVQALREKQGDMARESVVSSIDKDETLDMWLSDDPYSLNQRVQILSDYVQRVILKPPPNGESWGRASSDIPLDSIEIIPVPRRGGHAL